MIGEHIIKLRRPRLVQFCAVDNSITAQSCASIGLLLKLVRKYQTPYNITIYISHCITIQVTAASTILCSLINNNITAQSCASSGHLLNLQKGTWSDTLSVWYFLFYLPVMHKFNISTTLLIQSRVCG